MSMTQDEIREILNAPDMMINMMDIWDTEPDLAYRYRLSNGTIKRWPSQILADVRGTSILDEEDVEEGYDISPFNELVEVAEDLGYADYDEYNLACLFAPTEVLDRFYSLLKNSIE